MITPALSIKKLVVGQMGDNCYLLIDQKSHSCIIVDPGEDASYIAETVSTLGVTPIMILATHGHFDHILAAHELQMIYAIPFCIHKEDVFLLSRMKESAEHFLGHTVVEMAPVITTYLNDKEIIRLGKSNLHILHVPGHTPGGICIYDKKERILLVGDTIFENGGVGRTDFSYSSQEQLVKSISMILSLPASTILYPGHGNQTTVGTEKKYHG
jgi:hydroxyacylglutathione hydrolase